MHFVNDETGERVPGHHIGTDESGDRLWSVPDGFTPEEPYWLDEQGYAQELVYRDDERDSEEVQRADYELDAAKDRAIFGE